MRILRSHIIFRCLHVLLCMLILQQGFAFTVNAKNGIRTDCEEFESCLIELAEWISGQDIDLHCQGGENPEPQESEGEKESKETELKEDKVVTRGAALRPSSEKNCLGATDRLRLTTHSPGVITPPPEQR